MTGGGHMRRVSDPEIRKRQILETAMRLFYEKGYENTSLEDIAGELHVVKGLCYRYFASKQVLLDAVLDEYTTECCMPFLTIIHNREIPVTERLNSIMRLLLEPEENGRYHDFFHKTGNEAIHEQLAVRMCRYMTPFVAEELEYLTREGKLRLKYPRVAAHFLMYGQIGIWQEEDQPDRLKAQAFKEMAEALLNE